MIRRLVSVLIVVSLMAHFAARTGFLAFIYEQRHEIARLVGLADELPITECGSSYYDDHGLIIHTTDSHESVPPALTKAPDINFFLKMPDTLVPLHRKTCCTPGDHTLVRSYERPYPDPFQPPRG